MTTVEKPRTEDDVQAAVTNPCPQCGTRDLTARHCKAVCEQCGYVESCEDLFREE